MAASYQSNKSEDLTKVLRVWHHTIFIKYFGLLVWIYQENILPFRPIIWQVTFKGKVKWVLAISDKQQYK